MPALIAVDAVFDTSRLRMRVIIRDDGNATKSAIQEAKKTALHKRIPAAGRDPNEALTTSKKGSFAAWHINAGPAKARLATSAAVAAKKCGISQEGAGNGQE